MSTNPHENLSLPKNFSSSQINWIGIVTTLIGVLGYLQADNLIAQYPRVVSGIGVAIGLLTLVMRYIDVQPVRLPFQSSEEGEY